MAITTEARRRAAMLGDTLPAPDGTISAFDRSTVVGHYAPDLADSLFLILTETITPSDAATKHFFKNITEAPSIIVSGEALPAGKTLVERLRPLDWVKLKLRRSQFNSSAAPSGSDWTDVPRNTSGPGFTD